MNIVKKISDFIGISSYIITEEYVWVKKNVALPYGMTEQQLCVELVTGKSEIMKIKPSECIGGSSVTSCGQDFLYYFERYPKRSFIRFNPKTKETLTVLQVSNTVGAFSTDGEYIVYTIEPDVGVTTKDAYYFFNLITGEHSKYEAKKMRLKKHNVDFHYNWYFAKGFLFYIPDDDSFNDERNMSYKKNLMCYNVKNKVVRSLGAVSLDFSFLQFLYINDTIYMLLKQGSDYVLYKANLVSDDEIMEILRLTSDSYNQIEQIQMNGKGLFWVVQETHSLIESVTIIKHFDYITNELRSLITLSEFRPLKIRFNQVGDYVYYQDEFWKEIYCTNINTPNGKEKIESELMKK